MSSVWHIHRKAHDNAQELRHGDHDTNSPEADDEARHQQLWGYSIKAHHIDHRSSSHEVMDAKMVKVMSDCLERFEDEVNTYQIIMYVSLGLSFVNLIVLRVGGCGTTNPLAMAGVQVFMGLAKIATSALLLGPFAITCPSGCDCGDISSVNTWYPYLLFVIAGLWFLRAFRFFKLHQEQQVASAVQATSLIPVV